MDCICDGSGVLVTQQGNTTTHKICSACSDLCVMCGEPLTDSDPLPYHTSRRFLDVETLIKSMSKDCTPSCMWCGKLFRNKSLLEEHEAECG